MTQDRPDNRGVSGLHRTVCGDGPVLLLLHGVTRCGADWEPLLPVFAQQQQNQQQNQDRHCAG